MDPATGEVVQELHRDFPIMENEFGVDGFRAFFGSAKTRDVLFSMNGFGVGVGRKLALVLDAHQLQVVDLDSQRVISARSYSQLYSYWADTVEHSKVVLSVDGKLMLFDLHTGKERTLGDLREYSDGISYNGQGVEFLPDYAVISQRLVSRNLIESYLTVSYYPHEGRQDLLVAFLGDPCKAPPKLDSFEKTHDILLAGAGVAAVDPKERKTIDDWPKIMTIDKSRELLSHHSCRSGWFAPSDEEPDLMPMLFREHLVLKGESYMVGFPYSSETSETGS
jgi:hypothetical protein